MSDNDLLERIKQEDVQAFNILYSRYWDTFYAYLMMRLSDREVVQEVLQDLWIKIWKQPDFVKTNENGMAKGFLLKFLYFRVLDIYRKTSKIDTADIPEDQIIAYNSILEKFNENELLEIIKKAIHELPKATARIAELRLLENYSVEETALALSISKKTVRNKYSEALKSIRKNIAPDDDTLSLLILLCFVVKKF